MNNILTLLSILSFIIFSQLNLTAQKTNDKSGNKKAFVLKHEKPNFSITFPASFKLEESSKTKGLKTELYTTILNDDVYMIKYTEHENPVISEYNQEYLKVSVDEFVRGIKGTLINSGNIEFLNHKGIEAYILLNEKNLNVFSRIFIVNKVQYEIVVIAKTKIKTSSINNFFNSFIFGVQ